MTQLQQAIVGWAITVLVAAVPLAILVFGVLAAVDYVRNDLYKK
jgi:hypothetical protein